MNWGQDLRFAFRMMGKKPWFSAAIIVTLAFGIGINTTVFSLVNAVLYKPLPFPGGERLVMAWAANPSAGRERIPVSYADFRDFRRDVRSFEQLEVSSVIDVNLGEPGNPPERYRGARISAGMFGMLSVQPVAGRGLQPSDEKPGAEQAVVIGYGIWKDRYGLDRNVIGRAVRANGKPAVIVGVMPDGFQFPSTQELWMAIVPDADAEDRSKRAYGMIGMLREGSSIAEARAEMNVIARRLEQEHPDTNKDHGATILTFHQAMNGGPIRLVFLLMLGAVGFVLLIACANVANMLLSRAMDRTREVSIRAALGASRWRVVRQLLIESVVLSIAGGLLGLALARLGVAAFVYAIANVPGKPYWIDFSMDYLVFSYFSALTILAGFIFGLAPALSAARVDLNESLKEGSRGSAGSRSGRLSGALVVLQFALALVLLSGAGLMMRSFLNAQSEFVSLNGAQVLAGRITLPDSRYPEPSNRHQFFETLMPRLAALPSVRTAALVSNPPGGSGAGWRFEVEGDPIADPEQRPALTGVVVGKDYFETLGLKLLRGADFGDADGLPGKETVIISQTLASRFFPGQDPVGKQMRVFDDEEKARPWMTIVGVAPDIRQHEPTTSSIDPVIFVPYRFEGWSSMAVLLRTQGPPEALTTGARHELQQLDPDLVLSDVMTLQQRFERQRWYLRIFGSVFLIFAAVAMCMAAIGIYAVMAQATNRRTREIGVRMALGAGAGTILRLVLGRGVRQLALGLGLGLAAAIAVCRLMSGILFLVSPNDPLTLICVSLILVAAGLAATSLPARRAARIDPVQALRYE